MYYIIAWILQSLLWIPGQIMLKLVFRYRVVGLEHLANIDTKNGVLFVSNHRSQVDPVFVAAILPFFSNLRPMHFISLEKKEYAHIPVGRHIYGGFLFKIFGSYPVYRGVKDYGVSLRHHIKLLGEGKSVCIFPEGGIRPESRGKPRPGVAYLANTTNALVVPLAMTGEKEIEVRIGKPFRTNGENEFAIMDHVTRLAEHVA